ncbi:DUF456 domain-containing protein [Schnuerera sp. xch1]|nr:DUF456 domain-containing protein [Schnuerera sp. xch1]
METMALIISIVLFILGIIGTIFPVLPGSILVYGGMLVYGFMTNFESLTLYFFMVEALILLSTFLADFVATAASTRRFGGGKRAAWGAAIGTILGMIILGPIGFVLGPFIGATAAELSRGIGMKQAIRSGFGSVVGALGGTVFKLFAEVIMIVYFFMSI